MEVQLYVYDLSRGLAQQFSGPFLGTQIDAIYHTSVVVNGMEYFFGRGIQKQYPGMTQHGRPGEIIQMGKTQLDSETILDYLQSMRIVYTAESYDLFMNNCNNFTNDFCQFLLGKSIPDRITSLPQTVLNTPFGQMLRPTLDQAMRGFTQDPLLEDSLTGQTQNSQPRSMENGSSRSHKNGQVHNLTTILELDSLLAAAASSCAVIFFTSHTCPPCKVCYPVYDSLAAELGNKVTLIKVDISVASEIGSRYQVRATPTFISILQGKKLKEWQGADPAGLEQNIRLLVQMAHPPHPHLSSNLPLLQKRYGKPVLYSKPPPVEKILGQLGDAASDPDFSSLSSFVQRRFAPEGGPVTPIPNMRAVSKSIQEWIPKLAPAKLFALIDLLRIAAADTRISGFLAEEEISRSVFLQILDLLTGDAEFPYSAHITTVQLACNLFSSDLYPPKLLEVDMLAEPLVSLIAISLLDEEHATLRVSAASLAFNIASWNHRRRLEQLPDHLKETLQIELAASLVEATSRESNSDSLRGLILALGLLAFGAPEDGELHGVLTALEAGSVIGSKKLEKEPGLVDEVKRVIS